MLAGLKGDSEKLLTLEFTLNQKSLRPNVDSFDDICDCFFRKILMGSQKLETNSQDFSQVLCGELVVRLVLYIFMQCSHLMLKISILV